MGKGYLGFSGAFRAVQRVSAQGMSGFTERYARVASISCVSPFQCVETLSK